MKTTFAFVAIFAAASAAASGLRGTRQLGLAGLNFGCCSVSAGYLSGATPWDSADCSDNGKSGSSPPWLQNTYYRSSTNAYWDGTKNTGLSKCCEAHDKALYPGAKGDFVGTGSSAGNAADAALVSCVTNAVAHGTACRKGDLGGATVEWCTITATEIIAAMSTHPNGRRQLSQPLGTIQ